MDPESSPWRSQDASLAVVVVEQLQWLHSLATQATHMVVGVAWRQGHLSFITRLCSAFCHLQCCSVLLRQKLSGGLGTALRKLCSSSEQGQLFLAG